MTLMIPDFLARQLAAHATGLRCSLTATRSVPSLLNESTTPPSNVPRQRRVSTLTSYLSTASFVLVAGCVENDGNLLWGRHCQGQVRQNGSNRCVDEICVV